MTTIARPSKGMKITYMGKVIDHEELPDAPATELEDYFKQPALSAHAIDRASQVVPETYWKAVGIHTWLSGRAKEAFSKLPVEKREIQLGRLNYVFEYDASEPVLKTVILL